MNGMCTVKVTKVVSAGVWILLKILTPRLLLVQSKFLHDHLFHFLRQCGSFSECLLLVEGSMVYCGFLFQFRPDSPHLFVVIYREGQQSG